MRDAAFPRFATLRRAAGSTHTHEQGRDGTEVRGARSQARGTRAHEARPLMVFDTDSGLPGTTSLRVCGSLALLAQAVEAAVREAVLTAVRERGTASLVVAASPVLRHCYPLLARLDLPWQRVQITLCDECLVEAGHADRHERMLRELLLQGHAAAAQFVPLYRESDGDDAVAAAQQRLRDIPQPYDLVLLGLGSDSHIAALFPGAEGLDAALDPVGPALCCALVPPAGTPPAVPRLSLTLTAMLDSRRIVIAAQGLAQRDAFERAAMGHWPRPSPLHALALHAQQPVHCCWCR